MKKNKTMTLAARQGCRRIPATLKQLSLPPKSQGLLARKRAAFLLDFYPAKKHEYPV